MFCYAGAESDGAPRESDGQQGAKRYPSNIRAARPPFVMHTTQGCFAVAALALHMQHDYMAVQKQQCLNHEQFKKDYPHGRL
jgi:hypothetical protein